MKSEECLKCRDIVPRYAFGVNLGLAIYKGMLGIISGSAALVADALHSLADVVCTVVTIISLKISAQPADEDHHYGHGKIQFVSSSIVGTVLFTGAVLLFFEAFLKVLEGNAQAPASIAVMGAVISITINELMYRYQSCVGKELNSPALKANAWDNRSDALSSVGVLFGIVGALVGYPILDQIAAMFVALLVARIGIELITEAMHGLMDSSIELGELKKAYKYIEDVPGVRDISYIRGRSLGEEHWIDVEIEIDGHTSVKKADMITAKVKEVIINKLEHIGEVMVYTKSRNQGKDEDDNVDFLKKFITNPN